MALSRKMLSAMGIEAEKIDQIIEAHAETVNGLKEEINKQKEMADKLPDIQKELEDLKKLHEGKDYDQLQKDFEAYKTEKQKEFDDYKADVERRDAQAAKEKAFRDALKDANLSDKGVEKAIKYADWNAIEVGEDGTLKDAKTVVKNVREEWAEFIVKSGKQGADTPNPPDGKGNSTMTKEQIMAIKDRNERQKAISENHELFGY